MLRAVILTSHPDEFHAVRTHLTDREEKQHSQGTIYEFGQFSANGQTWKVAIAEITPGNSDAAMETERAIACWKPNVVLSVGVAAGLKNVNVTAGDVVAAIEVYGYETGKVTASGFSLRPKLGLASYKLEQRAKAEAKKEDWLERVREEEPVGVQEPNWTPKAIVGAIAAGEKEITSSQSELYQFLQSNYGDALAVDVTGYGVLKAVRANDRTNALVIRGITHVIDRDVTIDPARARKVAAQHASAFAFEILAKLENASSLGLSPARYEKLKQNLADASRSLLSWKSTLSNDRQIKRPELDELLDRVQTEESSTTIVLGIPGAGKSALTATLGNEAIARGYIVLAIKADQLNGAINTIEDLQRDLHLELHPSDAIHAVASKERIVVLIDQLDAVSELLDRKSQRLNLLLSLIQRLSGKKNIHIIATCREFEFHYGSQFSRLSDIEQLVLNLPAWENIDPILKELEHQPESMGEPLRELLQNPLHLNIFLDVAKPGEVFTSSQRLLDRLWEERVKKQPQAEKCVAFLEKLANRMTDDEVLWLPEAIADTSAEIGQALEQAGLLMTNPENGTIGFRHQTYYDHTLARAFARGSKSLTDIVLERQDGLFVRPILLRGLNYIRGTSPTQYELEIRKLLTNAEVNNWEIKNKIAKFSLHLLGHFPARLRVGGYRILQALQLVYIRTHIYTLLVEFIGSQQKPNPVEVQLFTSLLNSETEGPKVLDATIGSRGWFRKLRDRPEFRQWLEKPVEQAVDCSPLLATAASFAAEDVWDLLEEYWLDDPTYDVLSVRVIRNINRWTQQRVWLVQQAIQRSNIQWFDVTAIAERIAETLPDCAARIIRSHLDYLLMQAIESSQVKPPELPPDAARFEGSIHKYNSRKPLRYLLQRKGHFYKIEKFAQVNPKAFLYAIWPWFADLVARIARDTDLSITGDRKYYLTGLGRHHGDIIKALLVAILELAQNDRQSFLAFVRQNLQSDLLLVHRLLARGLEKIADREPQTILDYLLGDPRRLCLGDDIQGPHYETKRLISSICPHLSPHDRVKIEDAIRQFDYYDRWEDRDPGTRSRFLKYNRQHRLQLLLAFPDECLSLEGKRLRDEESRAFPWEVAEDRYPTVTEAQLVGPRMTREEMARAKDESLLNLFDELSDKTGWDNPMRRWSKDLSRAGGVVQQSREFGELVKNDPDRFLRLLPHLQPQRHESYVGNALVNLAEIDFPSSDLIQLVEALDRRGFTSEEFREEAARSLEKVAERSQGLRASVLALMESWLPTQTQPELEHNRSREDRHCDLKSSILFDGGDSHPLPNGRGNIVRAIAEGYLRQEIPDLEGWEKFIRSQLGIEPHPAVWVDILTRMPPLLNGDRAEATELFDRVIRNCPEVLQYTWALYFISRALGWFEPKETVQSWLEMLKSDNSDFSEQAYGELLLMQYLRYQDEWSVERIRAHLAARDNEALLCGLAHAASHLWSQRRCRAIAAEILYTLASSDRTSIQDAVANVFHWNRDRFHLDSGMLKIIEAVCTNQDLLRKAIDNLTEIIEIEEMVDNNPEVVAKVYQSLLGIGVKSTNSAPPTALIADSLTTIAIQLHRQPRYREVGLQIFERLLALNLRETRSALETLDRKPNRAGSYIVPRKRLRHRRTRRS